MDELDIVSESFCDAMDAELCRRSVWLNINAIDTIPRLLARVAVEDVLPAVRKGCGALVIAVRANAAAVRAIAQVERLIKENMH